jgi:hypothetical protein
MKTSIDTWREWREGEKERMQNGEEGGQVGEREGEGEGEGSSLLFYRLSSSSVSRSSHRRPLSLCPSFSNANADRI